MGDIVDVIRAKQARKKRAAARVEEKARLAAGLANEEVQAEELPPPSQEEPLKEDSSEEEWPEEVYTMEDVMAFVNSLQEKRDALVRLAGEKCGRVVWVFGRFLDAVDAKWEGFWANYTRRGVERELWRIAYEVEKVEVRAPKWPKSLEPQQPKKKKNEVQSAVEEEEVVESPMKDVCFSVQEVCECYRRQVVWSPYPLQALRMDSEVPLHHTICMWIALTIFLVLIHFILAMIVFSVPKDFAVDGDTGVLLNPFEEGTPSIATAAAVGLRALSDYPLLSLAELRGVQDVVFTHNMATHTLRIASVARTTGGSVHLGSADGTSIRVEADGKAFWGRSGYPEVRLRQTELWRDEGTRDPTTAWLTSGAFASQIIESG
jgi:hypothetical protein